MDRSLRCAITCILCLGMWGCSTSRYGVSYDEHLPHVKRIKVIPPNVQVQSRHTGGVLEARPDLTAEVATQLGQELKQLVRSHGGKVVLASATQPGPDDLIPQSHALADAIEQSITTHHYLHGKARTFDYSLGDLSGELTQGDDCDAVLIADLSAIVPTTGRKALVVAAAVVAGAAGASSVSTYEGTLQMMLIDSHTGHVLWYNQVTGDVRVDHWRGVSDVVKETGKDLLKPRAGGGA